MAANYLLTLDAGTSGLRCVIFDRKGRTVSSCRRDYHYIYPPDCAPLGREFAPQELWETVCECIGGAIKSAAIDTGAISGVSATGQREGAVFLDAEGRELYAGPNIDLRAVTDGLALDNQFAGKIFQITGHLPSLMFIPARLIWFRQNRPAEFRKIKTVLALNDWLLFRLCRVRASGICNSIELGLADVGRCCRSPELLTLLDLPESILPEFVPTGTRLGEVTAQAAQESGIPAGVAVVCGAPDSQCGLLGMGVKQAGLTGIVTGWSTPVQMVTERPVFDTQCKIWTGCHAREDKWILESNAGETGHALQWVGNTLFDCRGSTEEETQSRLERLASQVEAGAEGVLAYTGPELMDMRNLSIRWGGFILPLPFSATRVKSAQMARATLENIAFAVKANLAQIEKVAGQKTKAVSLGGGLARNGCLKQILPAVLNRPVDFTRVYETSALGAAMLAASAADIYTCPEEAEEAMLATAESCEPDRLMAAEYIAYYQRWCSVGSRLQKIAEEML